MYLDLRMVDALDSLYSLAKFLYARPRVVASRGVLAETGKCAASEAEDRKRQCRLALESTSQIFLTRSFLLTCTCVYMYGTDR